MADHRVRFTLGSYIQFESLDFLYTRVDHNLVLLPPSVSDDSTSPSGSDERVRDLDSTGVEGECIMSSPTESLDSPSDVNSVTESMVGLCLHSNEA
jgi:hypothetical protein